MKKTIYQKLQEARVILQQKNLKKSGKNKFSGFIYYELADFLPEINQIFADLGICSKFSLGDEIAELLVINSENPEENISFRSPFRYVEMKGCTAIQGIGALHTYMRRYLYINALEIVEADMLDAQAGDIKKPAVKGGREISADMISGACSADEINEFISVLKNEKYKDSIELKRALKNRAEEIGLVFRDGKYAGAYEG